MRKALTLFVIMYVIILYAGATKASTGWESNYDILWDITVSDDCSGETITYRNCILVEQNLLWISFIPDQSKTGDPHGKQIRISTGSGCTSVVMEESD
jgi:hypothetical protein